MSIQRFEPGKRMCQAVRHGDTLYLAGQVATDYEAPIKVQTQQVLDKVDALLVAGGSSKSRVLSVQVLLANIGDFGAMNEVYDAWVDGANPPARATFEARLAHPSLKVEIVALAAVEG